MKKSFLLIFFLIFSSKEQLNRNESDLIKVLLANYTKLMRPSDKVSVRTSIQLKQILSVDEKNQILTTLAYLHMQWNDSRLVWSCEDNNIQSTIIEAKDIWIPDLKILNTVDSNNFFSLNDNLMANVVYNGMITLYIRMAGLKTSCNINIKSV